MPVEVLVPKYRRNPNEKVESLFWGVAPGCRTQVSLVKPSLDGQRLERTTTYGPGLPRGVGGLIGVLVLGGMETTLDEVEYILQAAREQKFKPRRTGGEIAEMCRMLAERRNALVRYYRANPSEKPKRPRPAVRLHLPVGYRYVQTPVRGLKVLAKI